jgi:hypothetical protein
VIVYSGENKDSMDLKEKIFDQVAASRTGQKTVNEATESILYLFSVNEWYSSDDKQPPEHDLVLVCEVGGRPMIHRYVSNGFPLSNYYWKELNLPEACH